MVTDRQVRICRSKMKYRSRGAARHAALRVAATFGSVQRPYHCPVCRRFHLTSK